MDSNPLETRILIAMGLAALVLVACLASLAWDRRRAKSRWPAIRAAHTQPTQRPEPTVATVLRPSRPSVTVAERPRLSRAAPTVTEFDRATNHRMF